ncbi:hypothetical protein PMES_00577 [Profundibacterium mesophilum KAUST100406-0324]|uniref:Uncharacterized protein n=1 Tax=Profundibacterium mesophilum KAUST100406-0324 TaxID=1037889 RepID=A0A921P0P3_9RHOB|nr:hypothetical protein PMES_00577 [Profundibacterium mesophilum KAUST100406-0324]
MGDQSLVGSTYVNTLRELPSLQAALSRPKKSWAGPFEPKTSSGKPD